MFKGDIFITDDPQLAVTLSYDNRYKVLALMDNASQFFKGVQIYTTQVLLPPYTALEAENMGDLNTFYSLYYQHLASAECDSCISLILVGLYKGYNILFYVDKDEESMAFVQAFLKYMQDAFGLSIGNKENQQCAFNTDFEDIIRLKMYFYGYLPVMDIVNNIKNKILDPILCERMCAELKIDPGKDPVSAINDYIRVSRSRLIPAAQTKPLIEPPWRIVL